MPELIAKEAWQGQAAVTRAGLVLAPLQDRPIWSVALFPGGADGAATALESLGLGFPEPNRWVSAAEVRLVWTGRAQAFLMGAEPPAGLAGHAAVTDQSGGWAGVSLSGPAGPEALARLVPVDLRPGSFPAGAAIRAPVNHMSAVILRTGPETVEVWVFRSMARTLWHELTEVLARFEARATVAG
ncbi:sarcosine oxidase subunit gamma [Rhodobacter sp. Har01]|uniref:sarcosine oxidase subunit gamma n=1 Tax=Rhodobacter sp. Har01 TaxID=2883999 RepID=UPI001D068B96|nr:sarcosine oxidase subunit gamma family protein [Rhodobacter sp. Har01]MCB6178902.1 sarcosine oxidase subunit gamma [Rhodobacter sp. Har01]